MVIIRHMDIKFGALINVTGTYTKTGVIGSQTVVLHVAVKGKDATITMGKAEAEQMLAGLRGALTALK